nr:hypothetical protein [Tanacetum cinerariifolium]
MSKPRFTSQVDVNNNLSRPITQHYLPKRRESAFAKPDHMIASSGSRNSSKNMPRFSLNDMVHNNYLDEARKKTRERDKNSKTSVMPSGGFQSTANGSKPKPMSNNHLTRSFPISKSSCVTISAVPKADHSKSFSSFLDSKDFVCFTCHKCVFNTNHDAFITKLLKEVNLRALDEARKKTRERDKNSKTSVMPSGGFQSTANGSKPKPMSTNHLTRSFPISKSRCVTISDVPKADHSKSFSSFLDSKDFVCFTCHKCVFNANHDAFITKLLKEVNLRAKIQSHKTKNINKLVDQKSHTQKPGRQIFTGHRFSPNKTCVVYEKTSPRSDLRWKPTGRIFKSVGLRWIPTRNLFDSCTSKVDSEPLHDLNMDILNIHECKQTLDVSAGTSINVQKEQSLDLSADTYVMSTRKISEYGCRKG